MYGLGRRVTLEFDSIPRKDEVGNGGKKDGSVDGGTKDES
jgi:hypothetical protein